MTETKLHKNLETKLIQIQDSNSQMTWPFTSEPLKVPETVNPEYVCFN